MGNPVLTSEFVVQLPARKPEGTGGWSVLLRKSSIAPHASAVMRPVAGVALDESCGVARALDRCAFYLTNARPVGGTPGANPPEIQFEVRAGSGPATELVFAGTFNASAWDDMRGMLASVAGVPCDQFELWARVVGAPEAVPGAELVVRAVVGHEGGPRDVRFGELVYPTLLELRASAVLSGGGAFDAAPSEIDTRGSETGTIVADYTAGGAAGAFALRPEFWDGEAWRPLSLEDAAITKSAHVFQTTTGVAEKRFASGTTLARYTVSLRGAKRIRVAAAEYGNLGSPGTLALDVVLTP